MNKLVTVAVLSIGLFTGVSAVAGEPSEQLGTCLVDALNGKERKSLAKWIFFSMGAHPEIKSYMNSTVNVIQESDEYVGKLVTKILTEDCPEELSAAHNSDPRAIQKAFELVGQVAMQELMSNPDTMKALTNYAQYADQDKINAILSN